MITMENITWGELRRLHEFKEANGITGPDILSDPDLLEESYKYEDDEYVYDLSEEDKKFFEELDRDKETAKYYVAVTEDEDENPIALIRMENGSDVVESLTTGDWEEVGLDAPEIDDAVMNPVHNSVLEVWEKANKEDRIPTRDELGNFY